MFVLHSIREVFKQDVPTFLKPVEIDETYIGGKEKNKHSNKRTKNNQDRSTKTKTPVVGIIERGGKVYALPVSKTNAETIQSIVTQMVATGVKVYTDEYRPYKALNKSWIEKL